MHKPQLIQLEGNIRDTLNERVRVRAMGMNAAIERIKGSSGIVPAREAALIARVKAAFETLDETALELMGQALGIWEVRPSKGG